MWRWIKTHLLELLVIALVVALVVSVSIREKWPFGEGQLERIQSWAAATSALAVVAIGVMTAANVRAARKTTDASQNAVEAALRSERNAAAPVVVMSATQDAERIVHMLYRNIGRGPAPNLQCCLRHDELPSLGGLSMRHTRTGLGVGEDGTATWIREQGRLPILQLGTDIVAQYNDVFGNLFESRLEFVANGPPRQEYGLQRDPQADFRF